MNASPDVLARLRDLDERLRLAYDATANRHVRIALDITAEIAGALTRRPRR